MTEPAYQVAYTLYVTVYTDDEAKAAETAQRVASQAAESLGHGFEELSLDVVVGVELDADALSVDRLVHGELEDNCWEADDRCSYCGCHRGDPHTEPNGDVEPVVYTFADGRSVALGERVRTVSKSEGGRMSEVWEGTVAEVVDAPDDFGPKSVALNVEGMGKVWFLDTDNRALSGRP